jgi:hypothetical protein
VVRHPIGFGRREKPLRPPRKPQVRRNSEGGSEGSIAPLGPSPPDPVLVSTHRSPPDRPP